jgi:hypothetical protein
VCRLSNSPVFCGSVHVFDARLTLNALDSAAVVPESGISLEEVIARYRKKRVAHVAAGAHATRGSTCNHSI